MYAMDHPELIACNFIENSDGLKRVKLSVRKLTKEQDYLVPVSRSTNLATVLSRWIWLKFKYKAACSSVFHMSIILIYQYYISKMYDDIMILI